MFGRKSGDKGTTLVDVNCELTGDVHFTDLLMVNGTIRGNIYAKEGAKAQITISETGRVKGEIRVPTVIVNGEVEGDIHSDVHVELAAKAEIKGNVYYNLIEMVMGSRVDGNLVHVQDGKESRTQSSSKEKIAPVEKKVAPVTPAPSATVQS